MSSEVEAGQAYRWNGPDQRTGKIREQIVYVAYDSVGGQALVQDEAGYWIRVAVADLQPIEQRINAPADSDMVWQPVEQDADGNIIKTHPPMTRAEMERHNAKGGA